MVNFTENMDSTTSPNFFANAAMNSKFLELPLAKSLIFDLHSIWCQVQQLSGTSGEQFSSEDVLIISQRYREAINRINSSIGTTHNAINNEIYNAQILWALTEALYFNSSNVPLVVNLITWAGNGSFKDSSKLINERLSDESDRPEQHEFYWNSLILSILQVNLSAATRLLQKHSAFEKDVAVQQIYFFLESFQTFLEQGIPNPNSFLDVQRKVRDSLQNGTFKRSEQLTIVAGLLIGKNESFEKCARALYENWYELLPAYTLFTCPGANVDNIGKIAHSLYNVLCPKGVHVSIIESLVSDIDRPIFSILSQNLVDVLKQICEKSNLWWFPVHFIDLLHRFDSCLIASLTESFPAFKIRSNTSSKRQQALDENNQPLDLSDEQGSFFSIYSAMLVDYGKALLDSHDYWIISSDYFNAVNTADLEQVGGEQFLNVKLDSVNKAEYIYAQAVKNEHLLTKERVAKWFIERYIEQGCLSEALCWALRSNLPEMINAVSGKLLSTSSAEAISEMRIFDAMAEQFHHYPGLLLLQRFYEFRRCLTRGQASEAATRIHELVTSGIAPIGFQIVLFDQMAKLLDASNDYIQTPQLDRDSLYDLMKAVNKFQVQNSIINPLHLQKENATILELNAKIKFLRQALCNALASRSLN